MSKDTIEKYESNKKPGTSPYIMALLIGSCVMFLAAIVFTYLEIAKYRG